MTPVPAEAELQLTSDIHLSTARKGEGPGKSGGFASALARLLSGADDTRTSGSAPSLAVRKNLAAVLSDAALEAEIAAAGEEKAADGAELKTKAKKALKVATALEKKQLEAAKDGKLRSNAAREVDASGAADKVLSGVSGGQKLGRRSPADARDVEMTDSRRKGAASVAATPVGATTTDRGESGTSVPVMMQGPLPNTEGNARERRSHAGRSAPENSKVVLEVNDHRSAEAVRLAAADARTASGKGETANDGQNKGDRDSGEFGLRVFRFSSDRGDGSTPPLVRNGGNESFPAYLREHLNNQIVRQSGIILRNNNRGEIRLVLKPEHLGRVRLRIQLDENRLSGRIFVDSALVKDSFEQNMPSLYRAFRNSGFEASGFEVLVDSGEGNGASQQGSQDGSFDRLHVPREMLDAKTAQQLGDAVPILEDMGWRSDYVNLMA